MVSGPRRPGPVLATLAWLVLGTAAAAGAQTGPVEAATATVMRQLDAFRRNDFDAAYGFASDSIRALFDRPAFEQMVRGGYPEIAGPATAVVTGADVAPDGRVFLRLTIVGLNGRSVDAIYEMVLEGAGWRINGVVARPSPASA
jgi:hypothetical protein